MTEQSESVVAALGKMHADGYLPGDMKDTLTSAICAIQNLSRDNENLRERVRSVESCYANIKERINSFNHDGGVKELKEQLDAAKRGFGGQQKQLSELRHENGDLKRQLGVALASAGDLAEAIVNQSKMLARLANRI